MQSFKFRLQRVLQWQAKMCHIEEEGPRLCRHAVTEKEQRIGQLWSESVVAEQELRRRDLAASDLIALGEYRRQVARRGRELEGQRVVLVAELEKQMHKLTVARRQLQRIETLRDRALQNYNAAVNRELEELALESHLAKRTLSAGALAGSHPPAC